MFDYVTRRDDLEAVVMKTNVEDNDKRRKTEEQV